MIWFTVSFWLREQLGHLGEEMSLCLNHHTTKHDRNEGGRGVMQCVGDHNVSSEVSYYLVVVPEF